MLRSMTGFGRKTCKSPYGDITVEIKTLNHKSLSITCNPFNGFFLLEEKVKKLLEKRLTRGKAFVRVMREATGGAKSFHRVVVNEQTAREYLKKIKKAQKDLGIGGELGIQDLIQFPGVLESSSESTAEKKLWPYIRKALTGACDNLMDFRAKEGRAIEKDFRKRLTSIKKHLTAIKKHEKKSVQDFMQRLKRDMKRLGGIDDPDRARVEAEVSCYAKNCDIAEETTRLGAHIISFSDVIKGKAGEAGKKLDFIAQEMQREANTIGAKSGDFEIAKAVIEVKSEIEKLREQIKNVE